MEKAPGNWLPANHLKGKSGGILVFCSEFYGEFPWERLSVWFLYNLNIIYIIWRIQMSLGADAQQKFFLFCSFMLVETGKE